MVRCFKLPILKVSLSNSVHAVEFHWNSQIKLQKTFTFSEILIPSMFCKLRNLEFQPVDQEDPREQHFFISRYYSICVIIVNLYLLRLLKIGIHLFQVVKSRVNLCLLACGTLASYPRPISICTCKCLHLYSLEINLVWRKIRRRSDRFWQRTLGDTEKTPSWHLTETEEEWTPTSSETEKRLR